MYVLIYNTGGCCHYNEYMGTYSSEKKAINTYLMAQKRQLRGGDRYSIVGSEEDKTLFKCYIIYPDGTKCEDGVLRVVKSQIDILYGEMEG